MRHVRGGCRPEPLDDRPGRCPRRTRSQHGDWWAFRHIASWVDYPLGTFGQGGSENLHVFMHMNHLDRADMREGGRRSYGLSQDTVASYQPRPWRRRSASPSSRRASASYEVARLV